MASPRHLRQLRMVKGPSRRNYVNRMLVLEPGSELGSCVLVADGGRARILLTQGSGAARRLREVETLERPHLHTAKRDMTSDLTGRVFSFARSSGAGRFTAIPHGAQSDFDPHAAEVRRFAKRVSQRLEALLREAPQRDLILIVEPRFLGELRRCLTAGCRARVVRELPRDYVHASASRVQRAAFARRPATSARPTRSRGRI